jgi:hypothetical protein
MAFVAPILPALGSFFGSASGIVATTGAALGAATAISQGNYRAAIAKQNAKIAEANAARESMAGQTESMRLSQENAGRVAQLTADQAASGLSLQSGGFVGGRALETRIGAMEARDAARAGADRSQASMQQAANFRGEARNAKMQGMLGAAGNIIELGNKFARSPQAASLINKSPIKKRFS